MSSNHTSCVFGASAMLDVAEVACCDCGLDPMCLVLDYAESGSGVPEGVLLRRQQVGAGEHLFQAGQPFEAVYAVKSGSFKALMPQTNRAERVVGFYFAGELIGAEGIADQVYRTTVRALETSQVCVLRLQRLDQSGRPQQVIQEALIEMLGHELAQNQQLMAAMMRQNAEQRLAAFLLSTAQRLKSRGLDSDPLSLRMSRSDIGSYLGMARETVSRLLTRFQHQGLIRMRNRQLLLLDEDPLRLIVDDC